jgi:hypothetical protein
MNHDRVEMRLSDVQKIAKTYSLVRSAYARLAMTTPAIDKTLTMVFGDDDIIVAL